MLTLFVSMLTSMETFGDRLRRLREARGLSVVQLAMSAGVTENAIRQMELGYTKSASFSVGVKLAAILGISSAELAFGEDVDSEINEVSGVLDVESRIAILESTINHLGKRDKLRGSLPGDRPAHERGAPHEHASTFGNSDVLARLSEFEARFNLLLETVSMQAQQLELLAEQQKMFRSSGTGGASKKADSR